MKRNSISTFLLDNATQQERKCYTGKQILIYVDCRYLLWKLHATNHLEVDSKATKTRSFLTMYMSYYGHVLLCKCL